MSALSIRVMVQDAWDQVALQLAPATTVAETKQRALALTHTGGKPEEFLVKFHGAEVFDESRSLEDTGVSTNGSLIVMPRRRRPVR
ncbi:MAG: hypothetical protein ABI742_14895 [Gemmatimonadota bacterium]